MCCGWGSLLFAAVGVLVSLVASTQNVLRELLRSLLRLGLPGLTVSSENKLHIVVLKLKLFRSKVKSPKP